MGTFSKWFGFNSNVILRTERLALRHWTIEDVDDMYEYARVEGVGIWAGWLPHKDKEESKSIVESFIKHKKVLAHTYLAVRTADNRIVGIIDLRHHIDHPILGTWGGHCGYTVRPSERGRGYAKEMLRQNLINAGKMGITRFLITCHPWNTASEKTILANGGVFENMVDAGDGEMIKSYWIDVLRLSH